MSYHLYGVVLGVEKELVPPNKGSVGVIPFSHEGKPVIGLETNENLSSLVFTKWVSRKSNKIINEQIVKETHFEPCS